MQPDASCDEMIDRAGRIRTSWLPVMDALRSLGPDEMRRRAISLNRQVRLAAPFGAVAQHQYDPLPAPLTASEFAGLEAGLRQRATMLNALLEDLYGRQSLLVDGLIAPTSVFASRHFVRGLRTGAPLSVPRLSLYAADIIRVADGSFQILRDHTGVIPGLGHALTLRRVASGTIPELFRAGGLRSLRPAREMLADHLQRDSQGSIVAILSASAASPAQSVDMMDDALLARALGVMLIEPGDLASRSGALHVKTLSGLLHVATLIRGLSGIELDPLEQGGRPGAGIPGAFGAVRAGVLNMLNAPGTSLAETAEIAAAIPRVFERLCGETALLPMVGPHMPQAASKAPFVNGTGLTSLPLMFRLYGWHDGTGWQILPGGLAFGLNEAGLPHHMKDVWVLDADEPHYYGGVAQSEPPARVPFLPAAHLPSRVADNLFWLGRSVERLENAARLLMLALPRLESGTSLPRDAAERGLITRCLAQAELLPKELASGNISGRLLRQSLARRKPLAGLLREVTRLTNAASERLSPSMLATVLLALDQAGAALEPDEEQALAAIIGFCATFAGIAAENMSRDGGWLFLEMGRRLERAEAFAESLAILLEAPPERLEPGLALGIELADSVLSYDLRHAGVLAPGPVLAMILADAGNPRSLSFQCSALRWSLERLGAEDDAEAARMLHHEVVGLAGHATNLSTPLHDVGVRLRQLSDRVQRRFFTLLPEAHQLEDDEQVLAGLS